MHCILFFFFFKQKTAYEMRISDWSSDVCSSDLVALLRHDRRAGRPLVGQRDEAERLRRPDDEFLGEPRQMQAHLRRCHQIIEREIAIRYGIERIGGTPVETERGGGRRAIDGETRSGKRGRTPNQNKVM